MKKNSKGRSRKGQGDGAIASRRVDTQLRQTMTLRFSSTTGGKLSVRWENLLDCVLFAGTAVQGYDVFDLVKVQKVSLEVMASAENATTSAVLSFPGSNAGGNYGDGAVYEAAGMGTTRPARVSGRPAARSQTNQFHPSVHDIAFVIDAKSSQVSGNPQVLVEVVLEYRNTVDLGATAAQNALVSATPGEMYFRGLDGLPLGGTSWPTIYTPAI